MECDCDSNAILGGHLGKVGRLCKAHVAWMRQLVEHEREACAKIADDRAHQASALFDVANNGEVRANRDARGREATTIAHLIRARVRR